MTTDITFCASGANFECPRWAQCKRADPPAAPDRPLSWISGCMRPLIDEEYVFEMFLPKTETK